MTIFFRLEDKTNNDSAVTILKKGVYEIIIRTTCGQSGNQFYCSLNVSGHEISRCYGAQVSNYMDTYSFTEMLNLNSGDYVEVFQSHNGTVQNGNYFNSFIVRKLNK